MLRWRAGRWTGSSRGILDPGTLRACDRVTGLTLEEEEVKVLEKKTQVQELCRNTGTGTGVRRTARMQVTGRIGLGWDSSAFLFGIKTSVGKLICI